MKAASRFIFRKNWIALAFCALILLGIKGYSIDQIHKRESQNDQNVLVDTYIAESKGMTKEEVKEYIDHLCEPLLVLSEKPSLTSEETEWYLLHSQAISEFQIINRQTGMAQNVLQFAQTGEGEADPNILSLLDILYVFEDMQKPERVNGFYISSFFTLQSYNVIFLILMLLTVLIWGNFYESRTDQAVWISREGRKYTTYCHIILVGMFMSLSIINDVVDLSVSGVLSHPEYLGATIQSLPLYLMYTAPYKATIGEMIQMIIISRLVGLGILYLVGVWMAERTRELRTSLVAGGSLLLIMYFVNAALPFLLKGLFLPIGYVDYLLKFADAWYVRGLEMSTPPLVLIGSGIIFIGLLIHRMIKSRHATM